MARVPCVCMVCQTRFGEPCNYIEYSSPNERNIVEVLCPHSGGTTFSVSQGFRYELWAEEAFIRYFEGDFALSVSSISTALERFNEIFIKWSLLGLGLKKESVLQTWSEVSSLSERQRGALAVARAIANTHNVGAMPRFPSEKTAKLRNKVVHGGFLPSQVEAEVHIKEVLEYVFPAIRLMKSNMDSLNELIIWELSSGYSYAESIIESRKLDKANCVIGTLGFPYRLALHNDYAEVDFPELIEQSAITNRLRGRN